jgi:hypothetical protein
VEAQQDASKSRAATKIRPTRLLLPHNYFIEQLVDVIEKSPWENDKNSENSSLISGSSKTRLATAEHNPTTKIKSQLLTNSLAASRALHQTPFMCQTEQSKQSKIERADRAVVRDQIRATMLLLDPYGSKESKPLGSTDQRPTMD